MGAAKKFNWLGWSAFALLLCLWELGSRAAPKLQLYVPPISQVMVTLGQLALAGPIVKHLLITLGRFLEGYLLSAAIGVQLGVAPSFMATYPLATVQQPYKRGAC